MSRAPAERPSLKNAAQRIKPIIARLKRRYPEAQCALEHEDPLQLLVATILSAQCTDVRVNQVTRTLFQKYRTAEDYANADPAVFEQEIKSTGFFRNKTKAILGLARALLERHGGRVPASMEALTQLPGVGRKTATLVMILAFASRRHICVDTHVHRLANRLGSVRTRTPEETEAALYEAAPSRWWPVINLYLVTWGQNVCRPVRPRCGACAIAALCPRIGVESVRREAAS